MSWKIMQKYKNNTIHAIDIVKLFADAMKTLSKVGIRIGDWEHVKMSARAQGCFVGAAPSEQGVHVQQRQASHERDVCRPRLVEGTVVGHRCP